MWIVLIILAAVPVTAHSLLILVRLCSSDKGWHRLAGQLGTAPGQLVTKRRLGGLVQRRRVRQGLLGPVSPCLAKNCARCTRTAGGGSNPDGWRARYAA